MESQSPLDLLYDRLFRQPLRFSLDLTDYASLSMLTLFPATALIGLCPLFISRLQNESNVISSGHLLWAKMVAGIALITVELVTMAISASLSLMLSNVPFQQSPARCIAAICLLAVIYFSHKRTFRSSALLSAWFISAIACDTTIVRFYSSFGNLVHLVALAKASTLLKVGLLLLEELPKLSDISDANLRQRTRWQSTCGMLTRNFMLWPYDEVTFGFRHGNGIGQQVHLDPELASERLARRFSINWSKVDNTAPNSLVTACFVTLLPSIAATFICRVGVAVFEFSQLFYLYCVICFLETSSKTPGERDRLVIAAAIVYFGLTVSKAAYTYSRTQLTALLRSILITAIHNKTITLVQPDTENPLAVHLLSTELPILTDRLIYLYDGATAVVEVGISVYLAVLICGKLFIAAILSTIVCVGCGLHISQRTTPANEVWTNATKRRVEKSSELLSQIKAIKLLGLQQVAFDIITPLHQSELDASLQVQFWRILVMLIAVAINTIFGPVFLITGVLWNVGTYDLALRNIFTMVAISIFIINPLCLIIRNIPRLKLISRGFSKFQTFLLQENWSDERHQTQDGSQQIAIPATRMVDIRNASIASQETSQPTLANIHVSLNQGEVLMVASPSRSLQTAFLLGLIGEGSILSGSVHVTSNSVAYCGQVPWIPNLSVYDIIVGDLALDRAWYNRVLDICCLRDDLERLPDFDKTLAGIHGSNLGIIQQQKIGLARALYTQSSILVMDNIFTVLDLAVATEIFSRLLGSQGLLRESNKTVIMATNSAPFLQGADRVLVIEKDGTSSLHNYSAETEFHARLMKLANRIEADSQTMKGNIPTVPPARALEVPAHNVPQIRHQQAPARRSLRFVSKFLPVTLFCLCILTAFLSAITEEGGAAYISIGLKTGLQSSWLCVGYWLFSSSTGIATTISLGLWFFKVVPVSAGMVHDQAMNTILASTMQFLSIVDESIFIKIFTNDITPISRDISNVFIIIVYGFSLLSFHTSVITFATQSTILSLLFTGIAVWVVLVNYIRVSRSIRDSNQQPTSPLHNHITETTAGLKYIRCFGQEDQRTQTMYKLVDQHQRSDYHAQSLDRWLSVVTTLTVFVLGIAVVWYAAYSTPDTLSTAVAIISLMKFAFCAFGAIQRCGVLDADLTSIERIQDFIESTPREEDRDGEVEPPPTWPHNGKVLFEKISVTYDRENGLPPVLENVTAYIPGGWKVGIVGRPGSGKTSLILALLGFLEYTGRIVIDGVDISTVPRNVLRERIITISQDSIDLDGKVRSCLDPWGLRRAGRAGQTPTDEQMERVLKRLKLWDRISEKGGLDGNMADMEFTSEQRKMICIARACIHKLSLGTRLVVVDEALADFHPKQYRLVRRAMREFMWDCTILMVAHRLESLANVRMTIQIVFESAKVRIHHPLDDESGPRDRELPPAMKDYGPVEEIPAELEEIVRLSEHGEESRRAQRERHQHGESSRQHEEEGEQQELEDPEEQPREQPTE